MEIPSPRTRPPPSLLVCTLVLFLSFPGVFPNPEDRRYTRGTKFQGLSTEIHRNSKLEPGDDLHINAISTASITTTSSQPQQPAPVAQVLSVHIPPEAFHVHHVDEDEGITAFHSESVLGHTSSLHVSHPPALFIRPEGELPLPPDRFGFDVPNGHHPGAVPNCGCVSRGACLGKVGAYTRLVLPFTDIVCGRRFQTCCFDGPWAGDYDSFALAAACAPKEDCARPYGVLPTDVRDFGVIAPCPGQGAVRCLAVSSEELLEFQAAVAAIDAANAHQNNDHVFEPVHFMIPVVTGASGASGEGATTIEATATSSVSAFTHDEDGDHVPILPGDHVNPLVVVQGPAQPDINIHQAAPPHQNIIFHAATPAQPHIIVHQAPSVPDVNIHIPSPEPAQVTVVDEKVPVDPAVVPVGPAVVPVGPSVAPVVIPPAAVPGYYNPYYGAGLPWGGGLGFGKGFGIRKRLTISKGFNKGFIFG